MEEETQRDKGKTEEEKKRRKNSNIQEENFKNAQEAAVQNQ